MRRELGIARCGLACCICSENQNCAGCNADTCPDKDWCENRKCTMEKGIGHCYECKIDCRKGILTKIKPYAFTLFARRYGENALLDCLERNEQNGIIYHREGINGDYDEFDDVEELIHFIQTGRRTREKEGIPSMDEARSLLEEGGRMNPGPWIRHSEYVAEAAGKIAAECEGLDEETAYICGLLHDIGRRFGVSYLAHVYDGYTFLMECGYEKAARTALSHSFNRKKMEDYIGKFDISEEKQEELKSLLDAMEYDEYDYLIQLCDSIAVADGIVSLEERMNDVKSRYGYYPQDKWDRNMALKEYFEKKMGKALYTVVPMKSTPEH